MQIAAVGWAAALASGAAAFLVPLPAYAVPDRPMPVSPLSGSRLPALGTNLTWQMPDTATQYQLQVVPFNSDGPGINVIHNKEEEFRIPAPPVWYGLLPDMTYTWHLRATDTVGQAFESNSTWGLWSQDFTFRTPRITSADIREVYPALGASGIGAAPVQLQWRTDSPQVFYYEIQVSRDLAFNVDPETSIAPLWWNLVHGGVSQPRNSWTTPKLDPGAVYHWRGRPRGQGDGEAVDWSRVFSFTTVGG